MKISVLVLATCSLLACTKQAATIIIDDWWDVDYGKQVCMPRSAPDPARIQQAISSVREFERSLATELAASPVCRGIKIASFEMPDPSKEAMTSAAKGKFWSLSLNIDDIGAKEQPWQMTYGSGPTVYEGHGSSPQIAEKVCAIVSARGGTVR